MGVEVKSHSSTIGDDIVAKLTTPAAPPAPERAPDAAFPERRDAATDAPAPSASRPESPDVVRQEPARRPAPTRPPARAEAPARPTAAPSEPPSPPAEQKP